MPDQTINQLPEKISPDDNDLLILEDTQVGQTTKIKASVFKAGGEPYVEINSTGTLPTSEGLDSVAVGPSVNVKANKAVSVGSNNNIAFGSDNTVAVGSYIELEGGEEGAPPDMTVLGNNITIGSGSGRSVVIGKEASTDNVETVAVGHKSKADAAEAIALGTEAIANAGGAIQLGKGTNTKNKTLQLFNSTIANEEGIQAPVFTGIPTTTPADGSLAIDNSAGNEQLCMRVNNEWVCLPFRTSF